MGLSLKLKSDEFSEVTLLLYEVWRCENTYFSQTCCTYSEHDTPTIHARGPSRPRPRCEKATRRHEVCAARAHRYPRRGRIRRERMPLGPEPRSLAAGVLGGRPQGPLTRPEHHAPPCAVTSTESTVGCACASTGKLPLCPPLPRAQH